MGASRCPLHLLFLQNAFADHLIPGRFHERGTDLLTIAAALAKVRDELFVVPDVGLEFSSTAITRGSVSVSSVAVDLAEQIFGDLDGRKIMIIGSGETSEKTAKAFRSRKLGSRLP